MGPFYSVKTGLILPGAFRALACFMHEVPGGGLRKDEIAAMVRMAA